MTKITSEIRFDVQKEWKTWNEGKVVVHLAPDLQQTEYEQEVYRSKRERE